jgi:hypothetical protein
MADDLEYFADFALVGYLVSVETLAKLVDKGLISVDDAIAVLDDSLQQLEEWQSSFPEHHRRTFEFARDFLSGQIAVFGTIQKGKR